VLVIFIRLFFVNNVMVIAFILPIVFRIAPHTDFNAVWLGMMTVQVINMGLLLPTQTAESIAIFAMGHHSFADHFRCGSLLTATMLALWLLAGFFYWPLVGIPVFL